MGEWISIFGPDNWEAHGASNFPTWDGSGYLVSNFVVYEMQLKGSLHVGQRFDKIRVTYVGTTNLVYLRIENIGDTRFASLTNQPSGGDQGFMNSLSSLGDMHHISFWPSGSGTITNIEFWIDDNSEVIAHVDQTEIAPWPENGTFRIKYRSLFAPYEGYVRIRIPAFIGGGLSWDIANMWFGQAHSNTMTEFDFKTGAFEQIYWNNGDISVQIDQDRNEYLYSDPIWLELDPDDAIIFSYYSINLVDQWRYLTDGGVYVNTSWRGGGDHANDQWWTEWGPGKCFGISLVHENGFSGNLDISPCPSEVTDPFYVADNHRTYPGQSYTIRTAFDPSQIRHSVGNLRIGFKGYQSSPIEILEAWCGQCLDSTDPVFVGEPEQLFFDGSVSATKFGTDGILWSDLIDFNIRNYQWSWDLGFVVSFYTNLTMDYPIIKDPRYRPGIWSSYAKNHNNAGLTGPWVWGTAYEGARLGVVSICSNWCYGGEGGLPPDPGYIPDCYDVEACELAGGYWYCGACHEEPQEITDTGTTVNIGDKDDNLNPPLVLGCPFISGNIDKFEDEGTGGDTYQDEPWSGRGKVVCTDDITSLLDQKGNVMWAGDLGWQTGSPRRWQPFGQRSEMIVSIKGNKANFGYLTRGGAVICYGTSTGSDDAAKWIAPEPGRFVRHFECGKSHTVVLYTDGSVKAQGWNQNNCVSTPRTWTDIQYIWAGNGFTAGVDSTGQMFYAGTPSYSLQTDILALSGLGIVGGKAGSDNIVLIGPNGKVFFRGANKSSSTYEGINNHYNIINVGIGDTNVYLIDEAGNVFGYGSDSDNQLSDMVSNNWTNAREIDCDDNGAFLLRRDGTLSFLGDSGPMGALTRRNDLSRYTAYAMNSYAGVLHSHAAGDFFSYDPAGDIQVAGKTAATSYDFAEWAGEDIFRVYSYVQAAHEAWLGLTRDGKMIPAGPDKLTAFSGLLGTMDQVDQIIAGPYHIVYKKADGTNGGFLSPTSPGFTYNHLQHSYFWDYTLQLSPGWLYTIGIWRETGALNQVGRIGADNNGLQDHFGNLGEISGLFNPWDEFAFVPFQWDYWGEGPSSVNRQGIIVSGYDKDSTYFWGYQTGFMKLPVGGPNFKIEQTMCETDNLYIIEPDGTGHGEPGNQWYGGVGNDGNHPTSPGDLTAARTGIVDIRGKNANLATLIYEDGWIERINRYYSDHTRIDSFTLQPFEAPDLTSLRDRTCSVAGIHTYINFSFHPCIENKCRLWDVKQQECSIKVRMDEIKHVHHQHLHPKDHTCAEGFQVDCGGITQENVSGVLKAAILVAEAAGNADLDNNGLIYCKDFIIDPTDPDIPPMLVVEQEKSTCLSVTTTMLWADYLASF